MDASVCRTNTERENSPKKDQVNFMDKPSEIV